MSPSSDNNDSNSSAADADCVTRLLQMSAFLGFTGVGLGALGAHALQKTLVANQMMDAWRTGILYQLFHATSLLGLASLATTSVDVTSLNRLNWAGHCLGVGTLLFSGSIYGLCLKMGPKKILGPTTPLGGLVMLTGWGLLGFCRIGSSSASNKIE